MITSILLISFIPVLVGLLALKLPAFKNRSMWFFVSFAAGVMLGNTFYDLLPESVVSFALLGIIFFFLIEKYLLWHCHGSETPCHKNTTFLVMFGDTLHNFVDGIVIAGAFLASPILGVTTSLAIALHEIPQEVADFSILISGGLSPRKAIILNFSSGLIALAGGVLGYLFLSTVSFAIPYLTGFAAGMFIYIACSDLIPRTHVWDKDTFDIKTSLAFLTGIGCIKLFSSILH